MGGLRIRLGAAPPSPLSLAVGRQSVGLLGRQALIAHQLAVARRSIALQGRDVGIALSLPTYSTSFAGTEDPISEGSKWVNGKVTGTNWQNIKTSGGNALPTHVMSATPPPFDDNIAHLATSFQVFPANQYSEGVVFIAGGHDGDTEVELLVHFAITGGNARGYEIYWNTQQTDPNIVRWNGPLNDFDRLNVGTSALGPLVNGDVIRVEIVNGVITVKLNGAVSTSWDTSGDSIKWTTGQPGIGLNPFLPNGDLTTAGWSSWSCGGLP